MATINDIKNSTWASKFLASQGVSLEELDSLKDTSALTLAFEEFMLEKYQDPEISTPEQETRAESPEIQQRLEEIVNSNLENKPSGYPLKELNQDFEDIAYQTAIRSLALSEDEITQENLEKHIAQQSNRIATEYYSGIWAAQQPEKKLNGHNVEHYANVIENINRMVEQKQTKDQVYNQLLGGNRPSPQLEKDVTTLVVNTNVSPTMSWFKKMGKTGAKFLDRMQELEKEHPLAALATNMAIGSTIAAPAMMAYRMSVASRNIYKMSKESGMSIGQMLKDKNKRKELLSHGKAFARIIPGASIFLSADALKKHFNKEGRKGLVKTFVNSGKAIETLWQTKGKDKQAWKDLGKGVATIGGVALTVTAVAGFATHTSANEVPTDNISNQNENDVNHDTETNSYVATERLGLDTALETDLNGNPLDPTVMQNIINVANTELQQMDQMVANGEATVEYGQQQGVTTAYYQLENGSVRVSNDIGANPNGSMIITREDYLQTETIEYNLDGSVTTSTTDNMDRVTYTETRDNSGNITHQQYTNSETGEVIDKVEGYNKDDFNQTYEEDLRGNILNQEVQQNISNTVGGLIEHLEELKVEQNGASLYDTDKGIDRYTCHIGDETYYIDKDNSYTCNGQTTITHIGANGETQSVTLHPDGRITGDKELYTQIQEYANNNQQAEIQQNVNETSANAPAQTQEVVSDHQTELNRLPESLSFDASQELSPEQQDLRYLLLREPAVVNEMLNDGEFHSSAELQEMWNNGTINDKTKLELLNYAEGRFDDNGNFIDSNGNIDMEAENAAKDWQAQQDAKVETEELVADPDKLKEVLNQPTAPIQDGLSNNETNLDEIKIEKEFEVKIDNKVEQETVNNTPQEAENKGEQKQETQEQADNKTYVQSDGSRIVDDDRGIVSYKIYEEDGEVKITATTQLLDTHSLKMSIINDKINNGELNPQAVDLGVTSARIEAEQILTNTIIHDDLVRRQESGETLSSSELKFLEDCKSDVEKYTKFEGNNNETTKTNNEQEVKEAKSDEKTSDGQEQPKETLRDRFRNLRGLGKENHTPNHSHGGERTLSPAQIKAMNASLDK